MPVNGDSLCVVVKMTHPFCRLFRDSCVCRVFFRARVYVPSRQMTRFTTTWSTYVDVSVIIPDGWLKYSFGSASREFILSPIKSYLCHECQWNDRRIRSATTEQPDAKSGSRDKGRKVSRSSICTYTYFVQQEIFIENSRIKACKYQI